MSTRISFNQWLSLQRTGRYADLASRWTTTRGRLTRESVEERAAKYGADPELAGKAWDEYCNVTAA